MPAHLKTRWTGLYKRLLAVLFFFFSSFFSQAQEPIFRYFSTNDGLTGGGVFDILEDRQGYLWAATVTGISRFDGSGFRQFQVENTGRRRDGAFRMLEDKKGRIWFVRFNGKLCYFENDSFHIPQFIANIENENICWVNEGPNGTLYLGTRDGKMIMYTAEGETSYIQMDLPFPVYTICALNDSIVLFSLYQRVNYVNTRTKKQAVLHHPFNDGVKQNYIRFHYTPQKTILFALGERIMEVGQNLVVKPFFPYEQLLVSAEIFNMYSENDSVLWLPSYEGVSRIVYRGGKLIQAEKFKAGNRVYGVLKDRRDNIWLSTGFGLLRNSSLAVRYILPRKEFLDSRLNFIVKTVSGPMYVLTELGLLYIYKEGRLEPLENYGELFNFKTFYSNDRIYASSHGSSLKFSENGYKRSISDTNRCLGPRGEEYLFHYEDIFVRNGSQRKKLRLPYGIGTTKTVVLSDTEIWIGSHAGLYRFNGKELINARLIPGMPPDNICDMRVDVYGNTWITTSGYGTYVYKDRKAIQLKKAPGQISSDFCNNIYIDRDNNVWIPSSNGLNRISLDKKGKIRAISRFTTENAFFSGEVHDVAVENNKVYATTNDGLAVIDLSRFKDKTTTVPLLINNLYVNNKPVNLETSQFAYNENAVELDFILLNLGPGEVNYKYRLLPLSTEWTSSKYNKARFEALAPGKYTFQVAGNIGGEDAGTMAAYNFTILPPLWTTPQFYIPVVLLFLLLLLFMIRAWLNYSRRKIIMERNLIESELKVLRLQMNPHFLFNTLQSIQDFVIQKQGSEAIHYLLKFSRLMRMILNYSKRSTITLQEELGFIDHYVELEQMRNPGESHFFKDISPALRTSELHIPPMIIQPFIENSFKYALGKGRGNRLILSVQDEGEFIRIIIEDNGNGIKNSVREEEHEASGIAITTARIRRVSGMPRDLHPVYIEDLSESENKQGTRVSIYLKKQGI